MAEVSRRGLLAGALALAAGLGATPAWPAQDISGEVRQFSLLGDLSYSPAYSCDAAGQQSRTCTVRVVDIDPPKLPSRSVVYTDAQGAPHYGRLTLDFTSYTLQSTVVFARNGRGAYVPASVTTPQGKAVALWSMIFPGQGTSYIGGTLSSEDIRLSATGDGRLQLVARFGVKVSLATGPLTGTAGTATGACPTAEACTTTVDETFPVTPDTLMTPPSQSGAVLAAAARKSGLMTVQLQRGRPHVELALGRVGRLGKHQRRLAGVAAPGSDCVAHVRPLGTATPRAGSPGHDIPARAGATGYLYFAVDDITADGPKGRATTAGLSPFRVSVRCRHAGISAAPESRTIRIARR